MICLLLSSLCQGRLGASQNYSHNGNRYTLIKTFQNTVAEFKCRDRSFPSHFDSSLMTVDVSRPWAASWHAEWWPARTSVVVPKAASQPLGSDGKHTESGAPQAFSFAFPSSHGVS